MKIVPTLLAVGGLASVASASPTAVNVAKPKASFSWADTKYFVVFGDSYSYVQGTHGLQNFSFIGDYTNLSFKPPKLLNNQIVNNFTGTANGGTNWVEYLTGCGATKGHHSPLKCRRQLWDFAFGGADITTQYTPMHHAWTTPFVNQSQQFVNYGAPALSNIIVPDETLVSIWIGINDIGDSSKYNVSFPTFYNELMDSLFGAVEPIYSLGFKNFLFMNLNPADRYPGAVPPPNAMTTKVDLYNSALANHTQAFADAHTDAKVMLYDANSFLNSVLDNAWEWGIKNTTAYCPAYMQLGVLTHPEQYGCLPLSEYFWYNSGHMTSHVHEILAGAVEEFLVEQSTS